MSLFFSPQAMVLKVQFMRSEARPTSRAYRSVGLFLSFSCCFSLARQQRRYYPSEARLQKMNEYYGYYLSKDGRYQSRSGRRHGTALIVLALTV